MDESQEALSNNSSSKKPQKKFGDKIALWGLIFMILFNIGTCIQNNKVIKQSPPELEVSYIYEPESDDLFINIFNSGRVDCEKVWVEERIYAIIDSSVYEGIDIPHFNYLVFKDTKDKIFELKKSKKHLIKIDSLQSLAIVQLHQRFNAQIISYWELTYSSKNSGKQFSAGRYFFHDNLDVLPKILKTTTGGQGIKEQIENYKKYGNKKSIKIFDLTNRFELNTPDDYIITKDSKIRSLENQFQLSIEELRNTHVLIQNNQIQNSKELKGTLKQNWSYNRNKNSWEKSLFSFGKGKYIIQFVPVRSLLGYLSIEDYQKVIKNKDEYSFLFGKIEISPKYTDKFIEDNIVKKARENFIANCKYK